MEAITVAGILKGGMRRFAVLPAVLVLGGMAACGTGEDNQVSDSVERVEGTVYYRERMMLPPGAEVEVQLQDISRPDAMATVLATVLLTPRGGPPYAFAIDYNPARIDKRKSYALRATISFDQQLMFSSTDYIDPFGGNPVEVLVQRVPESVQR